MEDGGELSVLAGFMGDRGFGDVFEGVWNLDFTGGNSKNNATSP